MENNLLFIRIFLIQVYNIFQITLMVILCVRMNVFNMLSAKQFLLVFGLTLQLNFIIITYYFY